MQSIDIETVIVPYNHNSSLKAMSVLEKLNGYDHLLFLRFLSSESSISSKLVEASDSSSSSSSGARLASSFGVPPGCSDRKNRVVLEGFPPVLDLRSLSPRPGNLQPDPYEDPH